MTLTQQGYDHFRTTYAMAAVRLFGFCVPTSLTTWSKATVRQDFISVMCSLQPTQQQLSSVSCLPYITLYEGKKTACVLRRLTQSWRRIYGSCSVTEHVRAAITLSAISNPPATQPSYCESRWAFSSIRLSI